MKNIIFGRNFGNVLGQIRNFGVAGIPTILVWYGDDFHTPRNSKYIDGYYEVHSIDDGLDLIIQKFKDEGEKNFLSTDNDGIVGRMNERYEELTPYFYFFNAGENFRLTKFMDKMELCQLAESVGIKTPKSIIVSKGDLQNELSYPIFTKAIDSFDYHWKNSVSICNNESDLIDFYHKQKGEKFLLQEYINKKDEYILQGVSVNNGKDIYIPIQGGYYRLPDDAYGTYLHFEKNACSQLLYDRLKKMFEIIGYNGVFEIEFLVDHCDELYFLEINFRHTLWTHAFTQMGVNLSKIWMDSILCNKIVGKVEVFHSPHTLIFETRDFSRYVATGKISFFRWLREIYSCDSLLFWNKNDQRPFWIYIISALRKRLNLL